MKFSHLIDFNDMEKHEFEQICVRAADIRENPSYYADACRGKVMAALFYEPSTRTQFSFQTAMMRLGGVQIGFSDPNSSSVSKGESIKDTVKIVSCYSDIGVVRNPLEGAAFAAGIYSDIPIINAGDGGHLHPTQTMTDLFTIQKEKGRLDNLCIGICGDLLNGRTVHSLLKAFSRHSGNTFYLISTEALKTPAYVTDMLKDTDNKVYEIASIEECIDKLDVLYMTRIQRERFTSLDEYEKQKNVYVLDMKKLSLARKDLCILHPLPKVDEIEDVIDDDPRALYFEQAKNGMYIRMALILKLLERGFSKPDYSGLIVSSNNCENPRCITNHEKYLPHYCKMVDGKSVCAYCDRPI